MNNVFPCQENFTYEGSVESWSLGLSLWIPSKEVEYNTKLFKKQGGR